MPTLIACVPGNYPVWLGRRDACVSFISLSFSRCLSLVFGVKCSASGIFTPCALLFQPTTTTAGNLCKWNAKISLAFRGSKWIIKALKSVLHKYTTHSAPNTLHECAHLMGHILCKHSPKRILLPYTQIHTHTHIPPGCLVRVIAPCSRSASKQKTFAFHVAHFKFLQFGFCYFSADKDKFIRRLSGNNSAGKCSRTFHIWGKSCVFVMAQWIQLWKYKMSYN